MAVLLQFAYLQLLDLLTTLAFLTSGVQEANPVVRWALNVCGSPLLGLTAVKVLAVLIGIYCWRSGRLRVLFRANIFFAVLIAWNLLAIIFRPLGS